jgi:hypothetical protein
MPAYAKNGHGAQMRAIREKAGSFLGIMPHIGKEMPF